MIMYSLAMSIKKSFVIICIILYSVHQASSLRCYKCDGISSSPDPKDDCFVDPEKKDFESTCSIMSANTYTLSFSKFNLSVALPDASAVRGRETSYTPTDMDCFKMYSTVKAGLVSLKSIARGCIPKIVSDEKFKELTIKAAATEGITLSVDALYRCDTDLCNSSGTLSIGILSLICSLNLLFFTKL